MKLVTLLTIFLYPCCLRIVFGAVEDDLLLPPQKLDNDTLIYLQGINFMLIGESPKITYSVNINNFTTTGSSAEDEITVNINAPGPFKKEKLTVSAVDIQLKFKIKGGFWSLSNATLKAKADVPEMPSISRDFNNPLMSVMKLEAPVGLSFRCGKFGPLKVVPPANLKNKLNSTAAIQFMDIQFQTFMSENSMFGSSYDCIGYFSIGILSGWLITIILLGILSWGIWMVTRVSTMDRFDDPKGKTITVNTGE